MGLKGETMAMRQKLVNLKKLGQWDGCGCDVLYPQASDEDRFYMNEEGLRLKEERKIQMMYQDDTVRKAQPRSA